MVTTKREKFLPKNRPFILSTGSYVPEKVLTNKELTKIVDTDENWIIERTGIKQRHIASEKQATSDLAYEATLNALKNSDLKASDLDMIIVATITPDTLMPTTGCILQEKLGCKNIMAFDLMAACSGFVYSLQIASQYIANGVHENILVIGGDTLSRITNYKDRETCILFGDGAGASLVSKSNSENSYIVDSIMCSDGSLGKFVTLNAGGSRYPCSKEVIESEYQYVSMRGRELFKFAVRAVVDVTNEILNKNNLSIDEIDWIIPHQANIRILESAMGQLKFPMEKTAMNIDLRANTSAGTIPIALDEYVRSGKIKRGDLVLLVAFGGGFTYGATLMRF